MSAYHGSYTFAHCNGHLYRVTVHTYGYSKVASITYVHATSSLLSLTGTLGFHVLFTVTLGTPHPFLSEGSTRPSIRTCDMCGFLSCDTT